MALMTSMREKMHIVLWILLALFLLSMTVGGLVGGANIIDQLFGNVNPQTTIARINGEDISPDQFNNIVNQQLQNIRARGQKINDFHLQRARNTAWNNLIQDILVSQEVERLGITASDDEVIYHLENNPPPFLLQNPSFQTNGVFDKEKYLQALANPQGNEWSPIESFMRDTYIPNYKLQKMIDQSIIITKDDIKEEYIKRNLKFTLNGVHITEALVSKEDSKANEEDLRFEYNKSKSEYSHEGLRSISYVSWKKEPSKSDSNAAASLANDLYLRANSGEDFAELANEFSMDPGNQNTKGGDLGWFKKGRMVKPFEEAAFGSSKNKIVGPVKSDLGYHVIFVRDSRKSDDGEKEVLASHILIQTEISPSTLSNIKKEATLFTYDAQDFGFEKAIEDHGLQVNTFNRFDNSIYSISGLGGLRSAIRFAFNGKVNEISDILENDEYYAVCRIDSINPPGIKFFEEVKSQISRKLDQEKTKQATLEEANNLLIKLSSSGSSLGDFIKSEKLKDSFENETKTLSQGFTSIGVSHYINGALMDSSPGKVLGPFETNRGHAIVELVSIEEFDSTKYESQQSQIRDNIFTRKQGQLFQEWINGLKDNSEIIDNRKYYF